MVFLRRKSLHRQFSKRKEEINIEGKEALQAWIFYLYFVVAEVYYCRVPDARLCMYLTSCEFVRSSPFRVSFTHAIKTTHAIPSSVIQSRRWCHSISFIPMNCTISFHFIPFDSVSIWYGRRYDFIYHHAQQTCRQM